MKKDAAPVYLSTGYKVGRAIAVLSLLVILISIVTIFTPAAHNSQAGGIAICALILAMLTLFAGVMIAIANKPEAVATGQLRKSMSEDECVASQNHKVARRGRWVVGMSLLIVILVMLSGSWEVRTLGGIFGGGGVLVGLIIVFAYSPKGRAVDHRHPGLAQLLAVTGMIAMMFALGAAIARFSWPTALVAGVLSAFQLWAMFWGSRSGQTLALRGLGQLALIATMFYAAMHHLPHVH
jgi:hypothetical protein